MNGIKARSTAAQEQKAARSPLPAAPGSVAVILVAAGKGSRMGGEPKQFRALAGVPVLRRSAGAFDRCPCVGVLVVVAAPGAVERARSLLRGLKKPVRVVPGGATRQQSAAAGFSAAPVKDTVKVVNARGEVLSTPDRRRIWAVQTPKIFDRKLYARALEAAQAAGADYTDDCQLVERAGGRVLLVDCGYRNIKLTTPEDMAFAEMLLSSGEESLR